MAPIENDGVSFCDPKYQKRLTYYNKYKVLLGRHKFKV